MSKVLYCGMADDILTPLSLVPDLTTLYVIDQFDRAFSRDWTWESQQADVINCLIEGHDKNSHHSEVFKYYNSKHKHFSIDELCTIISNEDGMPWHVKFIYKGIERELLSYHHTNFYKKWSKEIKDISHLMCMGAQFDLEVENIKKMIKERCNIDCKFYDQWTKKEGVQTKWGRDFVYVNDLSKILSQEVKVKKSCKR